MNLLPHIVRSTGGLRSQGGVFVDILIQGLAIVGIFMGVVSMARPQKIFRYGFYAAVLSAVGLRIARSLGRGESAAFIDLLLAGFLGTALVSDLVAALRKAKE